MYMSDSSIHLNGIRECSCAIQESNTTIQHRLSFLDYVISELPEEGKRQWTPSPPPQPFQPMNGSALLQTEEAQQDHPDLDQLRTLSLSDMLTIYPNDHVPAPTAPLIHAPIPLPSDHFDVTEHYMSSSEYPLAEQEGNQTPTNGHRYQLKDNDCQTSDMSCYPSAMSAGQKRKEREEDSEWPAELSSLLWAWLNGTFVGNEQEMPTEPPSSPKRPKLDVVAANERT
ncbi:hypothetical protein CPB84DRAFT_1794258 [Gymnopilus junonius]|uniref:Uncharacterized protein n=1 Tax=Gymnopilus junonius TaxID=109634 RepID=A0A9P5TI91_GYMJU|nr:hypothetical protein CPB84DRAFT_1794258 [Gymnopilus junonius]